MTPCFSPSRRYALAAAVLSIALPRAALAEEAAPDFSVAERALFMGDQLSALPSPSTLSYQFRKSGSLEPGFEDNVKITVRRQSSGSCCVATGEFLSGANRMTMPEAEDARGNPVVMYFLERDVREMSRLTKGQANHFRKRIRMALFDSATVRDVALNYRGKQLAGREITVSPYLADPNRPRFEKLAAKKYMFTLSDAVPGGVVGIRSQVGSADAGAVPLIAEELWLVGADQKIIP